jgi:FKBP-type peptidyl-prolyl cis-trans isomerase SlyD
MNIGENKIVSFHYTLTNQEGEQLESSRDQQAMAYLHGAGNIIPGLEKAMAGKSVGDEFQVTVQAEEAYGERSEDKLHRIPAKHFKNLKRLMPGQIVALQTQQGQTQVTVVKIGRFNVDVDANHPLAGQALTFEVEVTEIRDASEEESAHGHVHGPGGVDH